LTRTDDNVTLSIVEIVDIPALANAVRERAAGEPLDRIEAAVAVCDELASGASELINQFVTEAREAGCSWTEIGQRIGVSKQAARQRFAQARPAVDAGGLERDPRLLACLELAGREAAAGGAAEVGTQHQLTALCHDPVAGALLEKLGVRADAVRAVANEMFPGADQPAGQAPASAQAQAAIKRPTEQAPASAQAQAALKRATDLARRGGSDQVGTVHLLCALALDPGSRARQVLTRLGVSVPAVRKELAGYISPEKTRRRRRGKAADPRCSFCGQPRTPDVRLIGGPGVYICADCVGLCDEILAGEAAADSQP
jgi:ATP-dependent Clp protease ATP-binding subunit ClpA